MILGCLLAGILISGVLSRVVLTGIEMKFDLPEHIFAEQPVLAELELRNEKQMWPSFSLRVIGDDKKNDHADSDAARFLSVHSAHELVAAKSGAAFPEARRLPAGCVRHSDAISVRLLRKDAAR